MIKLLDLINGTVRDPFTGELYEGLITTTEPNKAARLIEKNAAKIVQETEVTKEGQIKVSLKLDYPDEHLVKYTSGTLHNAYLSDLLKLINNLGYYITVFITNNRVYKYSPTEFRRKIVENEPREMFLVLSPKYGEEVGKLPSIVYHVTNSKYLSRIKQIGLKPATQSKLATHPERVYLALSQEAARAIASRMQELGKYKPVLLTIDTAKLPTSLKFYDDPHFTEQGVYTMGNIPSAAIIDIKQL